MNPISLVAGSSGFLGSNLTRELLSRGHRVIGLDNNLTSDGSNQAEFTGNSSFESLDFSVLDSERVMAVTHVDFVFHLASPASPPKYQTLALETIKANTIGTENLMRLAIKHSARFLFASTSEIYGNPLISPQPEHYWGNVNPIGPRSMYDESKRLGETLVSHFIKSEELNGAIIRIFNTYGPGMDPFDGRVVSTFIRQALNAEPFTVFGDGKQTRSFCFVDDMINGIIRMAESPEQGPVNLGNPTEIDLLTLGTIVARAVGTDASFHKLPGKEDDPRRRRPDISSAVEKLGWQPVVTLDEGVALTAKWMRQFMNTGKRPTT